MKCLVFCACERVLIDQQGNPSLIMLIENLNVPIDDSLPQDAIIPKEWSAFSLWFPDKEEYGKLFVQKIEFEAPDGTRSLKGSVSFTFNSEGAPQRVHQPFFGFPIGRQGYCYVHMWLENNEKISSPVLTYRINVLHQRTSTSKELPTHEVRS